VVEDVEKIRSRLKSKPLLEFSEPVSVNRKEHRNDAFLPMVGRQSANALFEGALSIRCRPERLAFSHFYVCEVSRLAVYPQVHLTL